MKRRLNIFALIFLVLAFSVVAETVNFEMGECVLQDVGSICPLSIATDSDLGTLSLTGASFNLISTTAVIDDVVFTNGLQDISVGNDYTFFGVDTSLVAGDQIATIFVTTISTPLLVDIVPITAVLGTGDDEVVLDEVVGGSISNSVDDEIFCFDQDCPIGLECVNTLADSEAQEDYVCLAGQVGDVCNIIFDGLARDTCQIDTYCLDDNADTVGICMALAGSGEPCDQINCREGLSCVYIPDFGDQQSSFCVEGNEGDGCNVGTCKEGNFCELIEDFELGVCKALASCGSANCNLDEVCFEDACVDNFCGNGIEDNGCVIDGDFVSGDTVDSCLTLGGRPIVEDCDDGNSVDNDGCTNTCLAQFDIADINQWIDSPDGVLIWDRNGDGKLQNEDVFASRDISRRDVDNGFDDLALLDSNNDGVINVLDDYFTQVRVWQNFDKDDRLNENELFTLDFYGITSLSLVYEDTNGEIKAQEGSYLVGANEQGYMFGVSLLAGPNRFGSLLVLDLNGDGGVGLLFCQNGLGNGCVEEIEIEQVRCGDGFCTGQEVCASDCTFTTDYEKYTTWVDPNDGILILDRNKDGVMQDKDFFGYRSLVTRDVDNGFEDIALFDSNGDGVINAQDEKFSEFQIWQDLDSDGFAIAGELFTLAEAGVAEVRLSYRDNDEEFISQIGTYKSIEAVRLKTGLDEVRSLLEADPDNIVLQERFLTLDASLDVENTLLAGTLGPGSFLILDLNNDGLSFRNCMSPTTVGTGCLVPECGNYGLEGDEECDSEDEFARGLCVLPGSADECRLVTINTAEQALNQILCILDATRCEGEIYTIEEQKLRVRDLFLMFLRGIGGEQ